MKELDFDLNLDDFSIDGMQIADSIEDLEASFDIDSLDASPLQEINKGRFCKPRIHHRVKGVNYRHALDAAKKLAPFVQRGERIYGYTSGVFIWGDFIESLILMMQRQLKELTVCTLGLNIPNIISMRDLLENKIVRKINLITSDNFYSRENSRGDKRKQREERIARERKQKNKWRPTERDINYVEEIHNELTPFGDRFTFSVCGIHSKVVLMDFLDGQKIVISGSSNLRSSANLEQFDIETNDGLYDFNKKYLDKIIDYFAVTGHVLRRNPLHDMMSEGEPEMEDLRNTFFED